MAHGLAACHSEPAVPPQCGLCHLLGVSVPHTCQIHDVHSLGHRRLLSALLKHAMFESWMAGDQGVSWVRRRIEEPVTQHLEAEGLDFLQFTFRRAAGLDC